MILIDQIDKELQRLLVSGLVVENMLTELLIDELTTVLGDEVPETFLGIVLRYEAILNDVFWVEARVVRMLAVLIDGKLLRNLQECSAISRVPGHVSGSGQPGFLEHLLVIHNGNGIPVLRQSIYVAVIRPLFHKCRVVLRHIDIVL